MPAIVLFTGILLVASLIVLYAVWKVRYRRPAAAATQILTYHKITDRFTMEGTRISPRRFAGHLDYLLERGYTFVDEETCLDEMDDPGPHSGRRLLLTFDDGYHTTMDAVIGELEARRIPALVFLVGSFAGRHNRWDLVFGGRGDRHLSWREARELREHGISFGSHGMTHTDLTRLGPRECREELAGSKRIIEDEIGCTVRSVSYPFGRYNQNVKAAAAAAGYRAAFSLYPAHPNDRIDRFALRRNGVYLIDTRGALRRKLEPGPLYWFEEMKCRTINATAGLTPLIKRLSGGRDN